MGHRLEVGFGCAYGYICMERWSFEANIPSAICDG